MDGEYWATGKANVQRSECKSYENGFDNQRWYMRGNNINVTLPKKTSIPTDEPLYPVGELFYIFANHSGDSLDFGGGINGINLHQYPCGYGRNQRRLILQSDKIGFYHIHEETATKSFDVEFASAEDGANVNIHSFHGQNNQIWKMNPDPFFPIAGIGYQDDEIFRS